MTSLSYLQDRLERVSTALTRKPGTNKALSKGCVILANTSVWRMRLPDWIAAAQQELMSAHKTNSRKGLPIKLTNASINIGGPIAYEIGEDPDDKKICAHIGNLFLETFLQEGTIAIERENALWNAPYIIKVLQPVISKVLLTGTYGQPLEPISHLRTKEGKPYIKGWTGSEAQMFKQITDTQPIFIKALNKLRATPFTLNQSVLEILKAEHKKFYQGSIRLTDKRGITLDYPLNFKWRPGLTWEDGTPFLEHDKRLSKIISKNYEYQIILAKAAVFPDTFYQEYTCDYRGRVYASESYLNFQGSDIARGLFLFANKKKYTTEGVSALKAHICNCYGKSILKKDIPTYFKEDYKAYLTKNKLASIALDKITNEDKVRWTNENLSWILQENSIRSDIEAPLMFLAACIELKAVLSNPDYEGGLPIPLDGSCNGLQHLAAMTKDKQAGDLVSLTDSLIQKDIYQEIGKRLMTDNKAFFKQRKMTLKDVRSGISKRAVMVRAYSAGVKRISENMWDDLHILGFDSKYNITKEDCDMLSKGVLETLDKLAPGPQIAMRWFQYISQEELSREGINHLTWVAPSGFPVVFKCYQLTEVKFNGHIKGVGKNGQIKHIIKDTKYYSDKQSDGTWLQSQRPAVDRKGFAKGIAPNVVHSQDAAHLSMVLDVSEFAIAVVHDSISVHGSDIKDLTEIIKEQFLVMYDTDNWFKDFAMNLSPTFEGELPTLGSLDLKEVMKSRYFFC